MAAERGFLDPLLEGRDPNAVFAKEGRLEGPERVLSERIPNAELDEHLEGERADGVSLCVAIGCTLLRSPGPIRPAIEGGHVRWRVL